VELTTQMVHGTKTYCCANCSEAAEASGVGSDLTALGRGENTATCAHCGGPLDLEAEDLALPHRALEVDDRMANAGILEAFLDQSGGVLIMAQRDAVAPEMVEDGCDSVL